MAKQSVPCDPFPAPSALATVIPWAGDHFGPGNNTTGNNTTYQTGGYNLNAVTLGMNKITYIGGGFSYSGTYFVRLFYPNNLATANETRGVQFNSVNVQWYYAANSNQVANNSVDLSGEAVRLFGFGL